jgi:hypothetical protein
MFRAQPSSSQHGPIYPVFNDRNLCSVLMRCGCSLCSRPMGVAALGSHIAGKGNGVGFGGIGTGLGIRTGKGMGLVLE